jgi:hypothetical protein
MHWYSCCNISYLAAWEVEIRRVVVPGNPGQKSLPDPISMRKSWGSALSFSDNRKHKIGAGIPGRPGQKGWSDLQNNQSKRVRGVVQVAEAKSWVQTLVLPNQTKPNQTKKLQLWHLFMQLNNIYWISFCKSFSSWVNVICINKLFNICY